MSVHTEEKLCPECLPEITLDKGSHPSRSANTVCVEEAVAWAAGEPHSDHPKCVSPVIVRAMIRANDGMTADERERHLKDLIFIQLGTNTGKKDDETRSWLAADWLVRTCNPAWFDLVPALSEAGAALRALAPLTDRKSFEAALPTIKSGREGAYKARRAAWERLNAYAYAAYADADAAAAYAAAAAAADAADADAAAYAYAADAAAAADAPKDRAARLAEIKATIAVKREAMWVSFADLIRRMCAVGREEVAA